MDKDRLFNWWYENKFDRFCEYMHAWHKPFNDVPEEHEKESKQSVERTLTLTRAS